MYFPKKWDFLLPNSICILRTDINEYSGVDEKIVLAAAPISMAVTLNWIRLLLRFYLIL